jgi:chromosome segregation ATPase
MNIDIDLGELRTRLEKTRQTISSLHKSGQINLRDYEVSKKDLIELNSGLTWTEKNLGGIFGGDKEKLKKIQFLKERISELRQVLKKTDTDLKSENNKVRDVVTEHLSKNSKRFRGLTVIRQTNQQLLNEVGTFLDLLNKAKKGISDALLLLPGAVYSVIQKLKKN